MTHVGTKLTPLGGDTTVSKLDEVESIVDIRLEVVYSYMCILIIVAVLILASQAYRQNRQWFGTNLLRKKEVLIESKAVGLIVVRIQTMSEGIVPTILVERTVFRCANRVFPLITSLEVGALDDTTTRETEDTWVKVFEVFYQVGTQAIPVVGREHRNMIEVYALIAFEEDAHIALLQGLLGCELYAIFLPLVVGDGDRLALHRIVVFIH